MRLDLSLGLKRRSSVAAVSGLDFNFATATYSVEGTGYSPLSSVPGYSFSRTGTQGAIDSDNSIDSYAANAIPVNGAGYHAFAALTNSQTYSQQFDQWTTTDSTISTNAVAAPDGATTAETMSANLTGITTVQSPAALSASASSRHTLSVFIKKGTSDCAFIQINATGALKALFVGFNLNTGAVGTPTDLIAGLTCHSASTKDCGSGWHRCIVDFSLAGDSTGFQIFLGPCDAVSSRNVTSGKTIHLWQAQSLAGSVLGGGPLITTTTAAASIGANALSVSLTNGSYTATYTFDDNTTQQVATTISSGAFAHPVYPTTLNRPIVKQVVLA